MPELSIRGHERIIRYSNPIMLRMPYTWISVGYQRREA
jgi:hypothetical protein